MQCIEGSHFSEGELDAGCTPSERRSSKRPPGVVGSQNSSDLLGETEEISQLIYHGCSDLEGAERGGSTDICGVRPSLTCRPRDPTMLRIAVPNKRSLSETAAETVPDTPAAEIRALNCPTLATRRGVLASYVLGHRDLIAGSGARRRNHRTCARIDRGRDRASTSGESTFRFAGPSPGVSPPWRTSTVFASRRGYPGLVGDFLAQLCERHARTDLMGRVERLSAPGSPIPWPTSSPPDLHCAPRASRSSVRSLTVNPLPC
jgi:hypothetical protein